MEVNYISHMGNDLTVVNAARVSFNKESHYEDGKLKDSDVRLLRYLAKNHHWTPFSHPQITFRIKAPIFVRTQLFKHKIGFTENEVSRRYVDEEPTFFSPGEWRGRPINGAKQGSSEDTVETFVDYHTDKGKAVSCLINTAYSEFLDRAVELYSGMIDAGVAPEQARMILPQSMYTEWYWTGSLFAYARMCKQRLDSHAQAETRWVAKTISDILGPLFPQSWSILSGFDEE